MARSTDTLGQFEQIVLMAVMALGKDAYGAGIWGRASRLAGREVNLGSTYVALDRLEAKGYVKSTVEAGTPERGGKPRRFYTIQKAGVSALRESVETAARVSESFWEVWGLGKWKPKRAK